MIKFIRSEIKHKVSAIHPLLCIIDTTYEVL